MTADRTLTAHFEHTVGITGAPGAGKSTLNSALMSVVRASGDRLAMLAVDPSSPFTGGAILGDRVRMQDHVTDDGVYIRSMATRGHLGGLSLATPQAVRVLDALDWSTEDSAWDGFIQRIGALAAELATLSDLERHEWLRIFSASAFRPKEIWFTAARVRVNRPKVSVLKVL